jgi:hypothetical protein
VHEAETALEERAAGAEEHLWGGDRHTAQSATTHWLTSMVAAFDSL